ncbi:MAG: hypothetical protein ACR2J0_03775 [Mycobacteriales bacterium]
MAWIVLDVALAVAGLVVLGLLAFRLWRQVRALGREVVAAGERLGAAAATLDRVTTGDGSSARPPQSVGPA